MCAGPWRVVTSTPLMSVVIPHSAPTPVLSTVLNALSVQTIPHQQYEVIVVADGPRTESEALVKHIAGRGLPVRFAAQPQRGPAAARNLGVRLARGERVLFLGDDVRPARDLLEHHRAAPSGQGVLGRVEWDQSLRRTILRRLLAPRGPLFKFALLEEHEQVPFRYMYTANLSLPTRWVRREPFEEAFSDAALEDVELGWRLARRGWDVVYEPRAVGYHLHPYDCAMFLRKIDHLRRGLDVLTAKWPTCIGEPDRLRKRWYALELLLRLWAPLERLGQQLAGRP